MHPIASRSFSEQDQSDFAELSGDWNPLHVDAISARRTIFGERLVHGVHQLLWALDRAYSAGTLHRPLESVSARFIAAVGIDQSVSCSGAVDETGNFTLIVVADGKTAMRATGSTSAIAGSSVDDVQIPHEAPREWQATTIADAKGSLPVGFHAALATRLFPALTSRVGASQLGVLLACTRLVGMECPGQHSLFASLSASFRDHAAAEPRIDWQVRPRGLQFGMAELEVQGPGAHAVLQALLRPRPRQQLTMAEAMDLVEKREFRGVRALVVGGSRGIGEAVAKLIGAGGGEVSITYNLGATDANRVCNEILAFDRVAHAFQFNVLNTSSSSISAEPTHVYYFATPLIRAGRSQLFSVNDFEQLARFYVSGFANTIQSCLKRVPEGFSVLYPSTAFLDEPHNEFVEYCAAKAAGEVLCRQLRARNPSLRIHAPRIPRVATDQTMSVANTTVPTAQSVMVDLIRAAL